MIRSRALAMLVPNDDSQWSAYDGDAIDLDYRVDRQTGDITLQRRYLAGIARQDAAASQDSYFHGDQIGSTRLMTGPGGAATLRALHTAFGLPLAWNGTDDTRYGYAGAWGYQHGRVPQTQPSDPPDIMQFLHVGERWYDPMTGRFLQRDPIGITGGLNTYGYCGNNPVVGVDPTGLINDWAIGALPPGWKPAASPYGAPTPPPGTSLGGAPSGPFEAFLVGCTAVAAGGPVLVMGAWAGSLMLGSAVTAEASTAVATGAGSLTAAMIGTQAAVTPGLGAGTWPAIITNGQVYVAQFHLVAYQMAGGPLRGPTQWEGFAVIDAAGRVLGFR
jgi:RHS repeat-associated protein